MSFYKLTSDFNPETQIKFFMMLEKHTASNYAVGMNLAGHGDLC